ncbi:MAG: YkgJ family cysteine cluster protein [Myxococcota bacterium]|nr:YkgJ family cysteine cluster protein [Myxococcota bacterium]
MSAENEPQTLLAKGPAPDPPGADAEATPQLLPVIQKASDHPCFDCSRCCRYVAVEIDKPSTMKEYDHLYWYLYHGGISVFIDWEGDWFIQFETKCDHLTAQGMCGIYERRPAICKDFDWRECEQNVKEEAAEKHLFRNADDFTRWFEEKRPKAFHRYQRFLRKRHASGEDPELERLDNGAPRKKKKRKAGK